MISHEDFRTYCVTVTATSSSAGHAPAKAIVQNNAESTNSPQSVEPMIRVHNHRPLVHSFIFANTKLLTKEPHQKAMMEANTIRGVLPKISSTAFWLFFQCSAGGRCTMTAAMMEANTRAAKPLHTTRRSRA